MGVAGGRAPLLDLFELYIFPILYSHNVSMSTCTVFREIRLLSISETFFFFSLIFLKCCLRALPICSTIFEKQNQTNTGWLCM